MKFFALLVPFLPFIQSQISGGVFKFTKYGSYPAEKTHCVANGLSPAEWKWPNVPGAAGEAFRSGKWVALTQTLMQQAVPIGGAAGSAFPGCGACVQITGKTKAGKDFDAGPFVNADMCNTTPGSPWFDQNCVNIPNNVDSTDPLFDSVADDSCGEVYKADGCGDVTWKFVSCDGSSPAQAPAAQAPAQAPAAAAQAPAGKTVDIDGKSVPVCQQAVANPTVDSVGRKWGWENNASCVVQENGHTEL